MTLSVVTFWVRTPSVDTFAVTVLLVMTLRVVTLAERTPRVLAFETSAFAVVVTLRYGIVNVS
jgi:hypothetical protein